MKRKIGELLFVNENYDKLLHFSIYILMFFGFICSSSASMTSKVTIEGILKSSVRYLIFLFVAIVAYHWCSYNYQREKLKDNTVTNISWAVLLLCAAAYINCRLIAGPINDNYSWLWSPKLPGFSLQPSEFIKPVVMILVAGFLADKNYHGIKSWDVLKKPVSFFLALIFIVVILMKDLGTSIVTIGIAFICLWIPRNKKLRAAQIFTFVCSVIVVAVAFFGLTEVGCNFINHISTRIGGRFEAVINPSRYSDATREIYYSLLGISKGKLFGVGLGSSVQKFGYIASSSADYIFAIIVEETGLIGISVVFGCYGIIIYRLLSYAFKMKKDADAVILVGTASFMFIHFFLNIGGVSGLIPLTGVPLLLVSRGGSSVLSVMIALGCSQSIISRYKLEKQKKKEFIK